jgi:tRNA (uracil-5-)-methyltransferase
MRCEVLGECGGCSLHQYSYDEQLAFKKARTIEQFKRFYQNDINVFSTKTGHFRHRIELKVWHEKDQSLAFAMRHIDDPKKYVHIESCQIAHEAINKIMKRILPLLEAKEILSYKLFAIDFLSSSDGEVLLSFLYHKKITDEWKEHASILSKEIGCSIIGRSKGVKIVVGEEYVIEKLQVDDTLYTYKHNENSFTQPNADINAKMISWLSSHITTVDGELLELYCGMGNLTIPLAKQFKRVCASEISKVSIAAAKWNMAQNGVDNIEFARLSSEDFTSAMDKERVFRRLEGIDISSYNFTHALVDPPRSGVDEASLALIARFDTIFYISCNPETLVRDLEMLTKTHKIIEMVAFDQFAYTSHLEMGVILKREGV